MLELSDQHKWTIYISKTNHSETSFKLNLEHLWNNLMTDNFFCQVGYCYGYNQSSTALTWICHLKILQIHIAHMRSNLHTPSKHSSLPQFT